jgi:predicted Fe-Mo cluster-binding NifX family protein
MRVTIPVTPDGGIEVRFGRAPLMAVATVDGGAIIEWTVHDVRWDRLHDEGAHGTHHARIVRFMRDNGVERVAFAHMGPPMIETLFKLGLVLIQVDPAMDARDAVLAVAAYTLDSPDADDQTDAAGVGGRSGGAGD